MPRASWPLWHGRPGIQVVLTLAQTGQPLVRTLLACFAFLNRFTYGNFGDPSQFGLEY